MLKLNPIKFAAAFSIDFGDEINDLDKAVNEAREDETMIDEAAKQFRHLNSLLSGVGYVLDCMEDGETKEQLIETLEEGWRDLLLTYWAPIIEMLWTKRLDRKVTVITHHSDGKKSYEVQVSGYGTFKTASASAAASA